MTGFYHFRRIVAMARYAGGLYLDRSVGSRDWRGRVSLPLFFPPHRGKASAGCTVDHPPVPPWSCLGCRGRALLCLVALYGVHPAGRRKVSLLRTPACDVAGSGGRLVNADYLCPPGWVRSCAAVLCCHGPHLDRGSGWYCMWIGTGMGLLVVRPDEPRCAEQDPTSDWGAQHSAGDHCGSSTAGRTP